jgi:hypothetical protein
MSLGALTLQGVLHNVYQVGLHVFSSLNDSRSVSTKNRFGHVVSPKQVILLLLALQFGSSG